MAWCWWGDVSTRHMLMCMYMSHAHVVQLQASGAAPESRVRSDPRIPYALPIAIHSMTLSLSESETSDADRDGI